MEPERVELSPDLAQKPRPARQPAPNAKLHNMSLLTKMQYCMNATETLRCP